MKLEFNLIKHEKFSSSASHFIDPCTDDNIKSDS